MHSGLKNAAQTFQSFMDEVIRGFYFVFVYIDDVLIVKVSTEEYIQHLHILFDRFESCCVVINSSKSIFGVPALEFLGHHIDSQGIKPLHENVEATINYTEPNSLRSLR